MGSLMTQDTPAKGYIKVHLGEELKDKITELAEKNERSTAAEARIALREHLRLHGRPDVVAGKE